MDSLLLFGYRTPMQR